MHNPTGQVLWLWVEQEHGNEAVVGDKGLDEDLLVGEVGQQGQQELDQVLGELEADAPFYENKDALNCYLEKVEKLLLHWKVTFTFI